MKRLIVLLALFLCVAFTGCQGASAQVPSEDPDGSDISTELPEKEITKMYITVNGNKLEVTLAENSSVDALVEALKEGDISYTADDYGNFEKVGNLGRTFPRNDEPITTRAGDVILYQGNNLCLYYGKNEWTFTHIGRIEGYSESELRTLLAAGKGEVHVTVSLK